MTMTDELNRSTDDIEGPSGSRDKGKQRVRDLEASPRPPTPRNRYGHDEITGSQALKPVDIPSRVIPPGPLQHAEPDLPHSSSSSNGHERRPSHTRAKSSLGSTNMFDFFGPSSLASNSTVATSFHFTSPCESPKPSATARAAEAATRASLKEAIDADPERAAPEGSPTEAASLQSSPPLNVTPSPRTVPGQAEPAEARDGSSSIPMPPLYPAEPLPFYEEAPEYTPFSPQLPSNSSRLRASAFRTAAAKRFLSSRIAKKLNLPPSLQSRLQGTQTPGASSGAQPASSTAHMDGRMRFVRSDSAPNLTRSPHSHGRRRIEVHDYAATAYVNGARMGPAPLRTRPASSRPTTAGSTVSSPQVGSSSLRTSTATGTTNLDARRFPASPLLRTAVSSASSSRRNSGESRPSSRATISSVPNGGLFTCGYSSNRSGTTTPTRPGLVRKSRSRAVSLRSLGDLFSTNRERNDSGVAQQQQADRTGELILSGTLLREVISPVSNETLISARVQPNSSVRPSLMNAAHSSPYAGVDAAASGSPVLIFPHQSQERKANPLQKLPRELILAIFKSLVDIHIHEHKAAVESGKWRGKATSETRWVGVEAALRELVRLSRVSRTFQSYVLDGQLWQNMEFSRYPEMTEGAMISIAKAAGPFVRRLDLHGHAALSSRVLLALSKAQRPRSLTNWEQQNAVSAGVPSEASQLEELDLEGCRQISTGALNTVLSRSPNLRKCKLGSLPCVDNTTLCVLAATATNLEFLDISRCRSVDGDGIRAFFAIQESDTNVSAVMKERNVASKFSTLHAAGVTGFDSATLSQLGRHWPNLEVLDLSYCSDVNDAAIAALVSSDGDVVSEKGAFVTLTPRQAGSQQDEEITRRCFPHLRRLNLSSCRALTDRACVSLSHALPSLEVLELANIGPAIKDAGLVKLFATVPRLQKLDLERATQITDAALSALSPPESHAEAFGLAVPDRDTLMRGLRHRGSLLTMARRSASRRRQASHSTSTALEEVPPSYDEEAVAALIPATGTHLTHLILSSANRLTSEAMLLLINRCPFLVHLEVDDTHATDEVAMHFVQLARHRKIRNAYLSLVDCRSFSRDIYTHLNDSEASDGGVRPRRGSRGYAFRSLGYDDTEPRTAPSSVDLMPREPGSQGRALSSQTRSDQSSNITVALGQGHDECNELKPVVKSFWGWQLVDARLKQKRKAEQRAAAKGHLGGRSKVGSVVAMAFGLPAAAEEGDPTGGASAQVRTLRAGRARWSRALVGPESGQTGTGEAHLNADDDDDDAARGCTVM